MYRGTLITDLLAAVKKVEQDGQERRRLEEAELHRLYALQVAQQEEHILAGAA